MKKILPIIVFVGIVIFFFKPFIINKQFPIPADNLIGLYNPYRDLYATTYPRGIPYKNFLISDPIEQQYPWRYLSISLFKNMQIPLWNPYNFSGAPLLANVQSAPFYPLNILFFVLPFSITWSILIVCQPLFGGLFMYVYLRKIHLSRSSSLLGSIVFAFSGFSMVWMEWNIIIQTILWLPLILYIKEILIEKFSFKWGIALLITEICAFLAGHLQTWFYLVCISNLYLIYRIVVQNRAPSFQRMFFVFIKKYTPFLIVGILFLGIISVFLIPVFQFINLSARNVDVMNWQQNGWFIPWQQLITIFVPDFFGNPATLNYWGIWNYMEFAIYVGIIPFIFVLFSLSLYKNKYVLFYIFLLILGIIFAFPNPISKLPFILHIPFIATAQPTRLAFVIDFSMAILAAFGMEKFFQKGKKIYIPIFWVAVIFAFLWLYILYGHKFISQISIENLTVAKRNLVYSSLVFFISAVILFAKNISFKGRNVIIISIIILIIGISSFDLLRFAQKFTPFNPSRFLYPHTLAIDFLQRNLGNYRYMTTDRQLIPPNVATMYKLQSVDGYDPLYLLRYGEFIAALERNQPNINAPFGFNRIITPHNFYNPLINLLGVKYILSLDTIQNHSYEMVFSEGETKIYENKNVLPRVLSVSNIKAVSSKQEAISWLYHPRNFLDDAVVENYSGKTSFSKSFVSINMYSANKVVIQNEGNSDSFIILTDINYPIWHAFIDNKETKIYTTDYLFRGVIIPAGKHILTFKASII